MSRVDVEWTGPGGGPGAGGGRAAANSRSRGADWGVGSGSRTIRFFRAGAIAMGSRRVATARPPAGGGPAAPHGPARRGRGMTGASTRPLRVLHIITRMIVGGAQENTLLSCALIDRRAFPSEILCGVETGAEGELHSECRARGVPLHLEPSLVRDLHLWKDLLALVRLVRFMRRGRYDVVHVHSSKAGILGRIAARLAGVPIVIHTAHGWAFSREQPKLLYWLYVQLERFCASLSDALIVVSRSDQDEALLLRVGRQQQYVL